MYYDDGRFSFPFLTRWLVPASGLFSKHCKRTSHMEMDVEIVGSYLAFGKGETRNTVGHPQYLIFLLIAAASHGSLHWFGNRVHVRQAIIVLESLQHVR